MTAKERILASRLIQKLEDKEVYAKQIGLSYVMSIHGVDKGDREVARESRMDTK